MSPKIHKGVRKIEIVKIGVHVSRADIQDGECLLANKCMVRVATGRTLRQLDPTEPNHHTRVDAGHIRFNLGGYHYSADTPKIAKHNLIAFDHEAKARAKAKRLGQPFVSKINPFDFTLVAFRGSKVGIITAARQQQINAARRRRVAAGNEKRKRYTLRHRVVGFA